MAVGTKHHVERETCRTSGETTGGIDDALAGFRLITVKTGAAPGNNTGEDGVTTKVAETSGQFIVAIFANAIFALSGERRVTLFISGVVARAHCAAIRGLSRTHFIPCCVAAVGVIVADARFDAAVFTPRRPMVFTAIT